MPRRKEGRSCQFCSERRKQKENRRNETEEEREARLQNQRTRISTLRSGKAKKEKKIKICTQNKSRTDALHKTESEEIRTEEYIHLRDAIVNDSNIDDIGTMVILPSSYIGSPRHMHEYTQDAMTYMLDVYNRVAKRGYLTHTISYGYTIKFIPRISTTSKLNFPIHKMIGTIQHSSENMIHGPCGPLNLNAPCMSDGKCTKISKPYLDDTKTEDDGYPKYRRRSPKTVASQQKYDYKAETNWK
ncbi:hypothetical protein EVAR_11215_1 [Eumeta japonica]|uniref:Helitron helicase-like domain-containing protein n=1 Tax=Eumeta variegata TaxID=151549 RepID=A0A4C1U5C9_EUMVA|nr:hypothetical protein EVAR_11215_1 [Eumeta japonica]